jgi:hypothetical protein
MKLGFCYYFCVYIKRVSSAQQLAAPFVPFPWLYDSLFVYGLRSVPVFRYFQQRRGGFIIVVCTLLKLNVVGSSSHVFT